MKTTIRKTLREISHYKGRTVLTLLGVLIGIIAVGGVLSAYSILGREMNKNFMSTNPASIKVNIENFDDNASKLLMADFKNLQIEARKTMKARISRGDGTYGTINLTAVRDFSKLQIDTFALEKGSLPEKINEMALERDCLKILKNLKSGVGEKVNIKLPQGVEKSIAITGLVHAPGLAPASMENYSYGFVSLDTMKKLGATGQFDELLIVSPNNRFSLEKMKNLSVNIKKLLVSKGYIVSKIEVPIPGKHPHASQLSSLLFLLQAFAIITLMSASIIIINLINFIMSKQTRQIAVMKTIGASSFDIAFPYLLYVFMLSVIGFIMSLPLSIWIASSYSSFAAGVLNFNITSYYIPGYIFMIQLLISILIPLVSAAYPIYKSCKKTIRDGLHEEMATTSLKTSRLSKLMLSTRLINSEILMSVNNLLRKKSRTLLVVLALAAGGILFMTSQNIVASIDKTVETSNKDLSWDYELRLGDNYKDDKLTSLLRSINGISYFEFWQGNSMVFNKSDGSTTSYYPIKVMPENTRMLKAIAEIRKSGMENSIIVNTALMKEESWLKLGSKVEMEIRGKRAEVLINSVIKEVPPIPAIYISKGTFKKLFGDIKGKEIILASANTKDKNKQREITRLIEKNFTASKINLSENWNIYVLRKAFADHLRVIVTFLSFMSMLAVIVGGISISSAIGINISERKREIGVIRAIGGKRLQILSMISLETIIIGLVSWIVGILLSYPLGAVVGNYFDNIFLNTNLENTISMNGALMWLAISLITSAIAGFIPAWRASTTSLKDMLSYE